MSENIKLVGGSDYVQVSGLAARGYSKIILAPTDVQGAINDFIQAANLLGFNLGGVQANPALGGADYVRASGLAARGYSKIVLEPKNVQDGVNDLLQAVILLGINFKADGPILLTGATH